MISALEAKKLSEQLDTSSILEKLERLSVCIEKLAKEKKNVLRTGLDHQEDNDLWITGGYNYTYEWKEATRILKNQGYNVTFFYEDGKYLTTMYTKIEW
jgi:predicted transcriptional regulator